MQLNLVDHRPDFGILQQVLQMMNLKIADSNRFDAACFIERFERSPGFFVLILHRPMNEV
ncbi:hypothetical protein D3C81_1479060 [compost metagenome]